MTEVEQFETFFLHVLLQLTVIIAAARGGAWVFGKLGQPQVVGEILAGLMLGPSLLGRVFPQGVEFLFPEDAAPVFRVLSELGLVLLMFLVGMEFDFAHLRRMGGTAASISAAGVFAPFVLGAAAAWAVHPYVASEVDLLSFVLVVAMALSITSIPVLGRIMVEMNIHRTRLGALTITAAAVDDAAGWILLAAVSAAVRGDFEWAAVLQMLLWTAAFVLAVLLAAPPVLVWLIRRGVLLQKGELSLLQFSAVLVLVLSAAAATNWIGVFSIFGPFVLGAALSHQRRFVEAASGRLRQFVYAFFLPIFFTYTGLRTDVGLLDGPAVWLAFLLLLAAAIAGKMAGCGLAARGSGLSWRESGCVAVMMNTRALMGLIAVNLGRELGLIPDSVYCMLVLMALATTVMTTPLLRRWLPVETNAPARSG